MNTHRKYFFRVQVPVVILGAIAIIHLLYFQQYLWLLATFVSWFLFYVMGEGIFFHRYFSHKAFETKPIIAYFFAVCGILGGFGGPIAFRCAHTGLHHAYTDTEKDLHSPVHGFWYAFGGWYTHTHQLPLMISKSLLSNKFYSWIEQHIIGIWWTAFVIMVLINWQLPLYTLGLAGTIGLTFAGISNSVGHTYGTRRFNTKDRSTNNAWLSWLTWQGGILHNNHHAIPNRYHDSHAWYEFDIGRWIIPLIATKINYPDTINVSKKT